MRKTLIVLGTFLMLSMGAWSDSTASATASASLKACPKGMVKIEGRFCIDRFEYPNQKGTIPQGGVTWLQAVAQCKAQGKRLCTSAQWQRACAGPSGRAYPYGDSYDRRTCVSGRNHTRGAAPSGSHADCKSEEGVFDLSGNLWEWVGLTASEAALAGGGWMTDGKHSRCDSRAWTGVPGSVNFLYGFRCCKTLKSNDN